MMWGIGIGIHTLGFLMYASLFNKNLEKLQARFKDEEYRLDYPEKKLEKMAKRKITNFWLLLAHISYQIIPNFLVYLKPLYSH